MFDSRVDVRDMMRKAHMWSVTTNNSIDSEDSKYIEQVSLIAHLYVNKPCTT